MYIPQQFDEPQIELLHDLMRARPLATLVVLTSKGIEANHIPLHLSVDSPFGTLRGHVARSNPIWEEYTDTVDAVAIFHGPDAYISPSWYATKEESGKVVPTWNYAVAHAYGRLKIHHDPTWVKSQLELLTQQNESRFPNPWTLADAPRDFTESLIKAIAGIEMTITKLQGKWKLSQNQPARNQAGVIDGLLSNGTQEALLMADLVSKAARNDS
jgi:transcriptional regulator